MDANLDRLERNLAQHLSYLHAQLPPMSVQQRPGCLIADSGLPSRTFNTVFFHGAPPASADVDLALHDIAARLRPFAWRVGPAAVSDELAAQLVAGGLEPLDDLVAMVLELPAGLAAAAPPRELIVERVRTAAHVEAFAAIIATNWQPPDRSVLEFYRRARDVLLAPTAPTRLLLGHWNREPVGTCAVLIHEQTAGIYSVAASADHRNRGIATALVVAGLQEAVQAGCSLACLQSPRDAVRVFEKLGFRPCGRVSTFH